MLRTQVGQFGVGAFLALTMLATNASAQATRTWVSGVGDDANPCSRTAPCKTFAGAISKTAAGGEIDTLDPGGWGAVTITKSITIDGGPHAGGILNSGTTGIIINAAGTDTVTIRNLSIQGAGSGLAGIRILGAGTVHIENCVIVNNTQKGIDAQPAAAGLKLFIKDTTIRGNTNGANGGGIFLAPVAPRQISAYLNRVNIYKNTFGIRCLDNTTTTIRDSDISGNDTHGIIAESVAAVPAIISVQGSNISRNASSGLRAINAAATIRVGTSMINDNNKGLESVFSGSILSFTNNDIAGNASAETPTGTIAPK